ncbi:hypothetical protein [Streptomyces ureilyticus]|uniref:Uncharacterized protein n=1 Tax=Streptomyces ureilyticus TaxID=1775131 RepID=A0ABX0DFD5_9ACTN|nr:hypothetical protein [Streptomyces ureilyticus]NGO40600.1 hypothetical protein [Streptomyces ureilyticus]
MTDDLTTPDRADRARMVWDLYYGAYGGGIGDLVADLMHLADVDEDEHPGGGAHAARQAVANYLDEQPTWPAGPPVYLAQYRPAGKDWITVAEGDNSVELRDVANCLWPLMQKADFRTHEIASHVDDIVRGHVLTADNGTEFRAIENPSHSG